MLKVKTECIFWIRESYSDFGSRRFVNGSTKSINHVIQQHHTNKQLERPGRFAMQLPTSVNSVIDLIVMSTLSRIILIRIKTQPLVDNHNHEKTYHHGFKKCYLDQLRKSR